MRSRKKYSGIFSERLMNEGISQVDIHSPKRTSQNEVVASDGEYDGVQLPGYCRSIAKVFSLATGESNPTTLSNRDR